jgi:hypothetical protein
LYIFLADVFQHTSFSTFASMFLNSFHSFYTDPFSYFGVFIFILFFGSSMISLFCNLNTLVFDVALQLS